MGGWWCRAPLKYLHHRRRRRLGDAELADDVVQLAVPRLEERVADGHTNPRWSGPFDSQVAQFTSIRGDEGRCVGG